MNGLKNSKLAYYDVQKFDTIREMLSLADEQAGDKAAFMYPTKSGSESVTYHEFVMTTEYLGTALTAMGFGKSHIANIGENSYKWVCVYLTALKSGGVYVPIDKELPFDDIVNVANNSESEILFYAKKFDKQLRENRDRFPNIKYFIGLSLDEDDGEFLSYDKLLSRGKELYDSGNRDYTELKSDENALKMLVYTSGTTGLAKGVMLTEHNLVSSVYYGLEVSRVYDRCLSVLPYHHTYEAVCGLLVGLHHHATICINDRLTNVLKNLQRYKPEYLYLVPAFAELFYKRIWATIRERKQEHLVKAMISVSNALLKVGIDVRRKMFKSIIDNFGGKLVKIVCGGAPIRPEVGAFFDSIGIYLINGYGITECSPLVSANREECNDCSTVGYPLRCVELKFDTVDRDGVGEICVRGDVVMKGYYKQEELTREVLSDDGWFHTGDYGCLNKKGMLKITGRKKNIIVLNNGKNIFPEEIEGYIQAIPYVKEVIVYSTIDDKGLETGLCAEVFPDFDSPEVKQSGDVHEMLKKDIAEATKELPMYKKISRVKVRDREFVKNTSNKIKRNLINKD